MTPKFYRQAERDRICKSLVRGASILVIAPSGMGKSLLAKECKEWLEDRSDRKVALTEPMAQKQLLESICEQLECPTEDEEGRKLTMDKLKIQIASFLRANECFLLLDDAQQFDPKFRAWLKKLVDKQKQPIAVFCTEAPKTDLFLVLPPPLILKPLPDHHIRDLMETTAHEWGLRMNSREFAALLTKASGNPAGARALVTGEFIGVDSDAAPTYQGRDLTPLLLIAALIFIISRFIGLGTGNPILYVMAGSLGSVFYTFWKLLAKLPKDGRKIRA